MIAHNVSMAISADIFEDFITNAICVTEQTTHPTFKFFRNVLADLVGQFHLFGVIPDEYVEGVTFRSSDERNELFYTICSDLERKLEMEVIYARSCWRNRSERRI